jgi:hypothetical protein
LAAALANKLARIAWTVLAQERGYEVRVTMTAVLVLRFCIRPVDGAFELLAIMDIRARSISFASRPRRPYGSPDHERAGETFSPSPLSNSQTSAGSQHLLPGLA